MDGADFRFPIVGKDDGTGWHLRDFLEVIGLRTQSVKQGEGEEGGEAETGEIRAAAGAPSVERMPVLSGLLDEGDWPEKKVPEEAALLLALGLLFRRAFTSGLAVYLAFFAVFFVGILGLASGGVCRACEDGLPLKNVDVLRKNPF